MSTIFKSQFDHLPDSAFVSEAQLVKRHKNDPQPTLLPFSRATLWREIKQQKFPAPKKISLKRNGWELGEVRTWSKNPEAYARLQINRGKA
jgi:predicted DNA-binding transcriptional regulator AlpA